MIKLSISHKESGRRLDRYLQMKMPGAGLSFLCRMIRKKNITVNGKKAEPGLRISENDTVEIFFSDETYEKFTHPVEAGMSGVSDDPRKDPTESRIRIYTAAYEGLDGIKVIYEDRDFLFADKPAGVLSQQAGPGDMSMNEWLVGRMLATGELTGEDLATFKPAFANRLDRNTSGIMLGGKSLGALQTLSRLIRTGAVEKYYQCIAHGHPDEALPVEPTGFLDIHAAILKDEESNHSVVYMRKDPDVKVPDGARPIHTSFRLIEDYDDSMLLEVRLHTGKSHQIRAQLSALGHPIVGDPRYGFGDIMDRRGRQLLHAHRVVFPEIPEYPSISGCEFTSDKSFS